MVRTQIQLAEEHTRRLRELAVARRESVAALIRQAVDQFLSSGHRPARPATPHRVAPKPRLVTDIRTDPAPHLPTANFFRYKLTTVAGLA